MPPVNLQCVATDALSRFLATQGIQSEVAYFAHSGFILGQRIRLTALTLVYRLESPILLICDCQAHRGPKGLYSAVSELISLVHQIEQHVPEVQQIHGLLRTTGTQKTQQLRKKLSAVLQKWGATLYPHVEDQWLHYVCAAAPFPREKQESITPSAPLIKR